MSYQTIPAKAVQILAFLGLFACGTSHKSSELAQSSTASKEPKVLALGSDLPACTEDLEAQPVWVIETKIYKICQGGQWVDAPKPDNYTAPDTPASTNDSGTAAAPETPPTDQPVVSDEPAPAPKPIEPEVVFLSDNEFTVCVNAAPGTYYANATRLHVTKQEINTGYWYLDALFTIDGDQATHATYGNMQSWDNQTVMDQILSDLHLVQTACPVSN